MPDPTPVDQFLADEGIVDLSAELPNLHVKPHLVEYLKIWCFQQGIAEQRREGAWIENLDAPLSERGARMCRRLQIAARVVRDVDALIQAHPDLLLRLLDWLTCDVAAKAQFEVVAAKARLMFAESDVSSSSTPPHVGQAEIDEQRIARLKEDVRKLEEQTVPPAIVRLETLLREGRSGWLAGVDPPGLVQRVSDEERRGYQDAIAGGDVAAKHLQAAWRAAWGVEEDGQKAFNEAIKALEAAFRPVATPKDPGATLSNIAQCLYDKPDKWQARLADARPASSGGKGDSAGIQALAHLLRVTVAANRRHAAEGAHSQNSLDDGRDAVSLAVAFVAMQRRSFLQRR